jgi:hypothetical protein
LFYPLNYGNKLYTSDVSADLNARGQSSKSPPRDLLHQRNKPSAAGDFELAKDHVEMPFHHRQTQTGAISDLLVTPPFADKPRNFLFAPSESDEMRQTGARCRPRGQCGVTAQILALDKKMRPRYPGRHELL